MACGCISLTGMSGSVRCKLSWNLPWMERASEFIGYGKSSTITRTLQLDILILIWTSRKCSVITMHICENHDGKSLTDRKVFQHIFQCDDRNQWIISLNWYLLFHMVESRDTTARYLSNPFLRPIRFVQACPSLSLNLPTPPPSSSQQQLGNTPNPNAKTRFQHPVSTAFSLPPDYTTNIMYISHEKQCSCISEKPLCIRRSRI